MDDTDRKILAALQKDGRLSGGLDCRGVQAPLVLVAERPGKEGLLAHSSLGASL